MKKVLINYGGVILFYIVIILGILVMNYDSNYFNKDMNKVNYQTISNK